MTHDPLFEKLQRLRAGAPPRVLDLFLGGVEIEPDAARSHALNLFRDRPAEEREVHGRPHDITATGPTELLAGWGIAPDAGSIDLLIGGHATGAFYVDSNARVNAPLRMALQTFRTLTVTATNTQIELRLRSVSNNTCGMMPGLRFDLTMPGTLTLLGRS